MDTYNIKLCGKFKIRQKKLLIRNFNFKKFKAQQLKKTENYLNYLNNFY